MKFLISYLAQRLVEEHNSDLARDLDNYYQEYQHSLKNNEKYKVDVELNYREINILLSALDNYQSNLTWIAEEIDLGNLIKEYDYLHEINLLREKMQHRKNGMFDPEDLPF